MTLQAAVASGTKKYTHKAHFSIPFPLAFFQSSKDLFSFVEKSAAISEFIFQLVRPNSKVAGISFLLAATQHWIMSTNINLIVSRWLSFLLYPKSGNHKSPFVLPLKKTLQSFCRRTKGEENDRNKLENAAICGSVFHQVDDQFNNVINKRTHGNTIEVWLPFC